MIKHVGAGPAVRHKGTYPPAPQWDLHKAYGLSPSHIQMHTLYYPR